jgi:hypothetical protein
MGKFFISGNHHGENPLYIKMYSILIGIVCISVIILMMYRFFRDVSILIKSKTNKLTKLEVIDLKDKLFGWSIGIILLGFGFASSLFKLI